MLFAYEGFQQNGDCRCFHFRSTGAREAAAIFSIEVELALFLLHRVPVQDGPRFCLQLLEQASAEHSSVVDRFRNYAVRSEDFKSLLLERQKKLAEKTHKAPRRPFRKPSPGSNLFLGLPSAAR